MKRFNIFRHIFAFVITAAVCIVLLLLSAGIPNSAIQKNMLSSAEYLNSKFVYYDLNEGIIASRIDHYADSILLNIANAYDSDDTLHSVMWSSYYFTTTQNENANLYDAVTQDLEPNQQYLRYWHGSITFVKPLLMFLSIEKIYILNAVIMAILAIWLIAELIRRKGYVPVAGMVFGLVSVAVWYVPLSLEYTWMFLLTFPAGIVALYLSDKNKREWYGVFFIVVGVITNFLDFLTIETLPCFIPLLLILWQEGKSDTGKSFKDTAKFAAKNIICFLIGYAGMWILKWVLASVILNINALDYVTEHISERLDGSYVGLENVTRAQIMIGSLTRNILTLLPNGFGLVGVLISVCILFWVIYTCFVYAKKSFDKNLVLIYLIIAILPYVRYLILHNHSFIHYFFTFRAQLATLFAIALIMNEIVDWRLHFGKKR
ncbi:MAG: hypothetical protein K6E13_05660 [Lachnospiraceae bacterium]|nr:hypothetical protein [Lachnospiraceae bacterium]